MRAGNEVQSIMRKSDGGLAQVSMLADGLCRPRVSAIVCFLLLAVVSCAVPSRADDFPKGKLLFLVARPSILDPDFSESVVLMLPVDEQQVVVGLIINKPTSLLMSKIFPDNPALQNSTDHAYLGGPVDPTTAALAFHAPKPPKRAMPLYDDVYLTFDTKFISKFLLNPKQNGESRLFLGRAQWAPKQLQGEALEGSWYSLRAEGAIIFDRDSERLWKRLHDRAKPSTSIQYVLPKNSGGRIRTVADPVPNSN